MVPLTVGMATAALLFLLAGLSDVASAPLARRRAVGAVLDDAGDAPRDRYGRLDGAFRGTRIGRRLELELTLAGSRRSPLTVVLVGAGVAVAVAALIWRLLAPVLSVLGIVIGILALRAWIRRGKERRLEAFISQMPDLARVLANATNAGLSIATALAIAGEELEEPARGELQRVSTSLAFGNDIETALNEIRSRLPSREVAVLMSTLLVSARAGGSLVTSLRTIADTLEDRKETRREIRSILAQSVATGYTVIGLGFGLLLLLNVINPGTVDEMTRRPLGQIALLFAGGVFTAGFVAIRRMTRIEA